MLVSVPLLYVGGGILAPENLQTSRRYAPQTADPVPVWVSWSPVGTGRFWDVGVCVRVRENGSHQR